MKKLNGLIASDGLAAGPLYCIMEQPETVIPSYSISENEIDLQKSRLAGAVEKAKNELSELISSSSDVEKNENDKTGEDIISTHILMLSDTAFLDSVFAAIEKTRMNAEFVLKRKLDETIAMLQTAGDKYLSARAVDIQDAFESVFVHLLKQGAKDSRFTKVPKGSIIAAKLIKPSEALLVKNAGVSS